MVSLAPEERVGREEIPDFVAAEVKDVGAPVLVSPLSRILVLVQGGSVETGQGPIIAWEMGRHPIHDHTDTGRVQSVDEVLKVLRGAVAAGRCVEAGDLVSPAWVVGMLRHGKELDMREAHPLDVVNEGAGQVAVAERLADGLLAPRSKVDFVDREGRLKRIALASSLHPGVIGPRELARIPDEARVLWRHFEARGKRVGLEHGQSVRIAHLELVMHALVQARDEELPNPGYPQQTHRMVASVPMVEITDHADPLRIRSPDREPDARHAIKDALMGAEFVIQASLVSLVEEEQVDLFQGWKK